MHEKNRGKVLKTESVRLTCKQDTRHELKGGLNFCHVRKFNIERRKYDADIYLYMKKGTQGTTEKKMSFCFVLSKWKVAFRMYCR